jgi:hypothetical protein
VTICAKAEDLQYWSDLLPDETVLTTLETLIKDEEQQVRLGAVSALPALHDVGRKLAAACVTVALEDRVPSVRRAAGLSLAALDCREETAVINERLRHKGRRQAVEILGDFYDAGKQLDGLPFWWRWLARRESRARAMEKHRLAIDGRARRGAAVGVLAGLVWSIVIGLPLIATVAWARWDLQWRNSVAMYGAYLSLAAILGGLYFGRKVAKLTAKQAAISRDGRWLLASWKDWLAPLVIFGAVLSLNLGYFLPGAVLAVVFSVVAGAFVACLRPAVWPVTPRWAIVLIALAAGLVPMTAAVVIFMSARESLNMSSDFMKLFVAVPAFLSFLSCTRVMALAETTRAHAIGPQAPLPGGIRRLTQVAVGLFALVLIPLHLSAFGTPWWSLLLSAVQADRPIPLPSRGSGYFKVDNPKDHPQWYEVRGLPDNAELAVRPDQHDERHSHELEQTLLFLMPGITLGSIVQPNGEAKGGQITLHPLSDLITGDTIALSETERRPYLLKLTRDEHTNTWKGGWYSQIEGAPPGSSLVMVFPETSRDREGKIQGVEKLADFGIPSRSFSASYPRATDRSYNGLIYSLSTGRMEVTLDARFPDASRPTEGVKDDHQQAVFVKDIYVPVLMSLNTEARSLYEEGSELMRARKFTEAMPKLEGAAKLSPDKPEYLNDFAWVLVAIAITKNTQIDSRAVEYAKGALQRAPDIPAYLDTLAHAEYLSGNLAGARDAWATLYRLRPGYSDPDPLCARDRQTFEDLKKQGGIAQ